MIRTAQLRVYVPKRGAGAFPPHLDPDRRILRVSDEFVWEGPTSDDAYTTQWNGATYVCPRYPRLRMLEGVLAHRIDHPGSMLASELAVRRASQEIDRIRASAPAARSHIVSAPWHVPLRWFALFDPEARELLSTGHGPTIRYRSGIGASLDRIATAIEILEAAGFDDSVIEDAHDVAEWLEGFTSTAMVELHYHTVARLFSDTDLVLDDSCACVHRSLEALERLDYEEAGRAYADVASRWAPAQMLAYVN